MEALTDKIKLFIAWKDDIRCPFETKYNGFEKVKSKIVYKKGNADKEWSIEEVWAYWNENIFKK